MRSADVHQAYETWLASQGTYTLRLRETSSHIARNLFACTHSIRSDMEMEDRVYNHFPDWLLEVSWVRNLNPDTLAPAAQLLLRGLHELNLGQHDGVNNFLEDHPSWLTFPDEFQDRITDTYAPRYGGVISPWRDGQRYVGTDGYVVWASGRSWEFWDEGFDVRCSGSAESVTAARLIADKHLWLYLTCP